MVRITSSTVKAIRSRKVEGKTATTMISTAPSKKPPRNAPRMSPMPPTTAAMKAFQPIRAPM